MFGSKTFSAFPQLRQERKPIRLGEEWKFVMINVGLLFFPVWFWMSVILKLGLGTDYFFDVMFDQLGTRWWGNLLLTAGVIFLPGASLAYSGMSFIQNRRSVAKVFAASAIVLLGLGFFAAVKRG